MGIGEWMGIRECRVHRRDCSSLEELFLKIRNESFAAGEPEIYRRECVIAFPAINWNNQVQIFGDNGDFTVIRSTMPVGNSRIWKPVPRYAGWTDPTKICMDLCQRTADQINAME